MVLSYYLSWNYFRYLFSWEFSPRILPKKFPKNLSEISPAVFFFRELWYKFLQGFVYESLSDSSNFFFVGFVHKFFQRLLRIILQKFLKPLPIFISVALMRVSLSRKYVTLSNPIPSCNATMGVAGKSHSHDFSILD